MLMSQQMASNLVLRVFRLYFHITKGTIKICHYFPIAAVPPIKVGV